MKRIGYLDGWRGLAIILVLLGHFLPVPGINLGTVGVDLFFVLSGRLMADILFVRRMPLPEFFLRRFSRVYPGLVAFTVGAALLFHATPIRVNVLGVLSALTFTINYAMVYFHPTGIFDHLWSLCIEEHSYCLLGLLAGLERHGKISARAWIIILAVIALANGIVQTSLLHFDYFSVYWRTDVECAPVLLAAFFFLSRRTMPEKQAVYLAPAFIALALLLKSDLFGADVAYSAGTTFLALAMCHLDEAPAFLRRALSFAPLRQMGMWSYSLYLWQQPFYQLEDTGYGPTWRLALGAFFMGLLGFYAVERPARKYLNARIERWAARRAKFISP